MPRYIGVLWLAAGVLLGSVVWSALRTAIYVLEGRQPNMGPELFILFAPVIAVPIVILASLIHVFMHRYFAYQHWWQWATAGILYSTVLLGLISPWFLLVPVVVNPFVLRAMTKRRQHGPLSG